MCIRDSRQTLWNAVEKAERGKNAQLAYSFDIARVAEQRACSEMTAGKHDMGMASENDVDIRRILHHCLLYTSRCV